MDTFHITSDTVQMPGTWELVPVLNIPIFSAFVCVYVVTNVNLFNIEISKYFNATSVLLNTYILTNGAKHHSPFITGTSQVFHRFLLHDEISTICNLCFNLFDPTSICFSCIDCDCEDFCCCWLWCNNSLIHSFIHLGHSASKKNWKTKS